MSAPNPTVTAPSVLLSPSEVAAAFLDAVVTADADALRALLTTDVWLRAMLVRDVVEDHRADAAVERFDGWIWTAHEVQVLHATTRSAGLREAVTYRLRLRPAWAPDVWHVIEQTGYLRIVDGRIRRVDLVCTGFVPEHDLPGGRST
jgi:hypothetical protein